jgi:carboxypeptidase Q
MPFRPLALAAACCLPLSATAQPADSPYQQAVDQIIDLALADSSAYERLAYLGDTFGHRLSGSQALEDALDWIIDEMNADGLENVRTQPVMVPHWIRGEESATMTYPREEALPMLGLGGSVGTGPEGVEAEVVVVRDFDELAAATEAGRVGGRIVVFNVPFTNYGETVQYRVVGAVRAAQAGAVASLIRSVGPFSMQTPHTGTMRYDERAPRIPHAALTIETTEMLQRMQDRGLTPRIKLVMNARFAEDKESRNVIAEVVGRERPEEVVVLGGHSDSWDVGQGAMDDGGGVIASWEALRLMKVLGLRPRRTVRVVLWTNEENGLRGAVAYRESLSEQELAGHQLAMESDAGTFAPVAFGVTATDEAFALLEPIADLLQPVIEPDSLLDAPSAAGPAVRRGGGGADIGPLMREGVPGMGLVTDAARYFWYHHPPADTVDKLDPRELARCAAAMAIMAYVAAEMPERLPHGEGL